MVACGRGKANLWKEFYIGCDRKYALKQPESRLMRYKKLTMKKSRLPIEEFCRFVLKCGKSQTTHEIAHCILLTQLQNCWSHKSTSGVRHRVGRLGLGLWRAFSGGFCMTLLGTLLDIVHYDIACLYRRALHTLEPI